MANTYHHLYSFLSACAGNWRSSVYISADSSSYLYLLSANRDGCPIVMTVEKFQQLTGEQIDPAECCGQLSEEGFNSLYGQYLLWRLPSDSGSPLAQLAHIGRFSTFRCEQVIQLCSSFFPPTSKAA